MATTIRRWAIFNGIGLLGVGVQLAVLTLMTEGLGVHYLAATAIAVEAAVLHNFVWHQRVTWRDRSSESPDTSPSESMRRNVDRLVRFHALNGAVSLAGNFALVALLTGAAGMPVVGANLVAIACCSLLNFFASDLLVFKPAKIIAIGLVASLMVPVSARAAGTPADVAIAELTAATIAAWQQYERQVDTRYARAAPDAFFAYDTYKFASDWRQQAMAGQVPMVRVPSFAPGAAEPSPPDGRIHHWAGAIYVPNVTLDQVLRHLKDRAGRESEAYDDVLSSKLLARDGDRVRVYMKLRRESVITVTYNTEHDVEYRKLSETRASSRSVATKIAEVDEAGTPNEREKPVGNDHGFLWRLNAYWRYEQVKGGVLIECESVSLSRSVPVLLRPFVTGTVERIARDSLQRTLVSLRKELQK
jgi:putative flippase GtrA